MIPSRVSVKAVGRAIAAAFRDSRGATAIEYGLIVSLVVISIIVAIASVGNTTSGMWNNTATKVQAVTPQ